MPTVVTNLDTCHLHVDEIYGGSRKGNFSDDPLPSLLGVDNGAGFRHLGKRPAVETLKLLALKTNFSDPNWPDALDKESGTLTYYGDNLTPGELHKTARQGNLILRNLFEAAHQKGSLEHFPPILVFGNSGHYRDLRFLGLAVPGTSSRNKDEDLVAVWRTSEDGVRFQNYKAQFTILDVSTVTREWIVDVQSGNPVSSKHAPKPWLAWLKARKYTPLVSQPVKTIRSKSQQLPRTRELEAYVSLLYQVYNQEPHAFERCAMEISKLFMPDINGYDLTRPWRDGGRDAVGIYRIGQGAGSLDVEFAMEAKCYALERGVGVISTSRLISRLRYRQFGILVTTSYLSDQAYKEIIDDAHPVVVISAADIALKLREKIGSLTQVKAWLQQIS
jgi:hypothetical protein